MSIEKEQKTPVDTTEVNNAEPTTKVEQTDELVDTDLDKVSGGAARRM